MKSDLLSILRNLSLEEIKRFRLLLQSRYFYKNKKTYALFEELYLYYPLFEISEEDKIRIYKKIYGNASYNDSTYRSLYHQLLSAAENYLLLLYMERNEIDKDFILLTEFKNRNIDELFFSRTERLKRDFQTNDKMFAQENLMNRFKLNALEVNYSISNERVLHKITLDSQLKRISLANDYLSLYFYTESINDYAITEVYKRSYNIDSVISTINITPLVKSSNLEKRFFNNKILITIIDLYKKLYVTFKEFDNTEHYKEYLRKIIECKQIMSKNELLSHYYKLISYCIIKKNHSVNAEYFKNELWNLYNELVRSDLLINDENRYLDLNLYRSILFLGLSLNIHTEVKKFIDTYSKKVNPIEVKNIIHLSYAYLNYEIGECKKALAYATKIKVDDFIFKYDIKNLLIKLYYDLGYLDSLVGLINGYKEFLRNDPILNKDFKSKIKLFIEYLEFLITYAGKKDKVDIYFQFKKLQDEDVYGKEWLINKYSEYLQVNVCVA